MTRFRFGIRDLLWAMVVVALGLGWWIEHKRSEKLAVRAMVFEDLAGDLLDPDRNDWRLRELPDLP